MGRLPRITQPGLAYHVLNRRVMRLPLFAKGEDYLAFERVLAESLERPDAPRLLAWCLMPNHWHLIVSAGGGTNLSTWMQWVTVTHTHRWHAHTHTIGDRPLYQGRFKSFPVFAEFPVSSGWQGEQGVVLQDLLLATHKGWRYTL